MNETTLYNQFFTFLICALLVGCSNPSSNDGNKIQTSISGVVQKGPFINGTQITISELNSSLQQTGNVFNTEIDADNGTFEIDEIELSSSYVELTANGFYFNEIDGEISSSQLTLHALANVEDQSTLNVNIITHLEKARVEYLMSEEDLNFGEAKETAQQEILLIFEIDTESIEASETLDITNTGEGNSALLALSIIIQAGNTVGEMSELLANLSDDIKENGYSIDNSIIEQLKRNVINIPYENVKENLTNRYSELGDEISIPAFESYINNFTKDLYLKIVETDEEGVILSDHEGQWEHRMDFDEINSSNDGSRTMPSGYAVYPPYPNPFQEKSTFEYQLPQASEVLITIKEQNASKTDTLVSGTQSAGYHSIDLNDLATGYYKLNVSWGNTNEINIYGFVEKQ